MKPAANHHLIGERWQNYRHHALPPDAGAAQITGSRRAFYAGALQLFNALTHVLEPDREPTIGDLAQMQALHDELHDFFSRELAATLKRTGPPV
jgi:hypothetical protein